jgi:hypothetical protein
MGLARAHATRWTLHSKRKDLQDLRAQLQTSNWR